MISLSVIIPIARPCAPFVPVTGTAPQSHSTIICATSRRLVSGVHMAGLSVMMSRIVISYPPLIFTTTKSGAALFCDRSDYRRGHRRGFDEPAFPNPNVTAGWFLVFGFWYLVIRLAAQRVWACRSVLPLMHCSTLPPTVQRSMLIARGPTLNAGGPMLNAHRPRPNAQCSSPTAQCSTLIAHGLLHAHRPRLNAQRSSLTAHCSWPIVSCPMPLPLIASPSREGTGAGSGVSRQFSAVSFWFEDDLFCHCEERMRRRNPCGRHQT